MKKRPDGRYKVSATIGGKRRYFYGRTIKEAEQRRDQFKNALHAAPNVDYNITLGQWLSIWLRGARATLAEDTFDSYVFQLRRYVLPTLAKVKLIELQPHMFRDLIASLLSQGYSNRTVQYAIAVVRIGLRQAVNDGIIPTYPLRGVKLPTVTHDKVLALTKEEATRFLASVHNPKHHNLYWVALYTGLRRSELLGLRINDVDMKNKTLTVNQTVLNVGGNVVISQTTKNKSSHRTISIDDQTLAVIRNQEKSFLKSEWHPSTTKIITCSSPVPMDARMIRNIFPDAQRHTAATQICRKPSLSTPSVIPMRRSWSKPASTSRSSNTALAMPPLPRPWTHTATSRRPWKAASSTNSVTSSDPRFDPAPTVLLRFTALYRVFLSMPHGRKWRK